MQDPFADKSNSQLNREVQLWMAGLACLLVVFLYLSVKRMTGSGDEIPAHMLQSSVAQVTPPLQFNSNPPALLDSPQLKSAPAIPAVRFSADAKPISHPAPRPLTQPSFGLPNHRQPNHRQPAATFAKSFPRPLEASAPRRDNQLSFPKPTFTVPANGDTADAEFDANADANAEAIGRRRARQLAAMTSGLPQRLNRIQSSIQKASAELPVENTLVVEKSPPKKNGFMPVTPVIAPEPEIALPAATTAAIPLKPVTAGPLVENPIVVTPSFVKPNVESSKPVEPIVAESFSIKPIRQPDSQSSTQTSAIKSPAEIEPAKFSAAPNSFRPLRATPPAEAGRALPAVKPLPVAKPLPARDQEEISFAASSTAAVAVPAGRKLGSLRPPKVESQSDEAVDRSPLVSGVKQHVVETGESFFTIAQQHYGDGQWFRALRAANQELIASGDGLQPGMSLAIPTIEQLSRQFPDQAFQTAAQQPTEAQRRVYETKAGDTLFDIARHKLGQGSRFSEIIRNNEFSLPAQIRASDKLPGDLRLVLPESKLQ